MLLSLMKGICIRCSTGRRRAHACYVNVPDDNWKENKGEARKDHDREGNVQADVEGVSPTDTTKRGSLQLLFRRVPRFHFLFQTERRSIVRGRRLRVAIRHELGIS